jgi:subtilisin family serine protease
MGEACLSTEEYLMRTRLWMAPLLSVALVACDGDSALEGTGEGADGASGTGGASEGNAPGGGGSATGPRTVTLVTGDRVTMLDGGRYSIEPAKGRTRAVFHTRREHGRLHVVPDEAVRLIAAGLLDPRLFDVTGLLELDYDDAQRADLPLIVKYRAGSTRAAPERRLAAAGARVTQRLASIDGASLRAPRSAARAVWSALAGSSRAGAAPALAGEIAKVWLDGKRELVLDRSATQIGAPEAWAAGYTGAGVTVAVLDTGIDAEHPDFAGRIVEARSFLEFSPDAIDEVGHGTHVASILAGSGAASDGTFRGIAPDALLLIGKVCDFGCPESAILAGMEWAATSGARIVNMSLSGLDTPVIDPLEEAVNALTAEHGTLFVAAAGNEGTCGGSDFLQVGSPSTADAALSVGAVDPDDQLASFSCRGPRTGDGGLKPDITAPGVAIAAARAAGTPLGDLDPVDDFYARLDGTSMATPHVAGAAALLSQQHPDWRADDLKATLMASAEPNAELSAFQQGTGRVAVERAIVQELVTSPPSLSLGRPLWPHDDDEPITRSLTYRNRGADPVALSLALDVTGPDGAAAPAGMFVVEPSAVTVPAGGDAQVSITVDTRVGATDGVFAGALVATGAGQPLRTTIAVDREVESYDLELVHIDRDGNPGISNSAVLDLDSGSHLSLDPVVGTSTSRLPRGRYMLDGGVEGTTSNGLLYIARLVQPLLELDAETSVTLDAREAQPIRIVVPTPSAIRSVEGINYLRQTAVGGFEGGYAILGGFGSEEFFDFFYTAQLGAPVPAAELATWVQSQWAEPGPGNDFLNSPYTYDLSFFPERGRFPDGLERSVEHADLAEVRNSYAAQAPDQLAFVSHFPVPDAEFTFLFTQGLPIDLPMSKRVSYLSTEELAWSLDVSERNELDFSERSSLRSFGFSRYEPGRHRARWNDAVLGPDVSWPLDDPSWMTRLGNAIDVSVAVALRRDRDGHVVLPDTQTGHTRVFRGDSLIGQSDEPGRGLFEVPPEPGEYRVEVESIRGEPDQLSTQVSVAWTFRSEEVTGDEEAPLPLLSVRFAPEVDGLNRAPSDRLFLIPITLSRQPGAPAASLRRLSVDASYDGGQSWKPALVIRIGDFAVALVHHPAGEGMVSLRAEAVDRDDNQVEQTILGAYRLRGG